MRVLFIYAVAVLALIGVGASIEVIYADPPFPPAFTKAMKERAMGHARLLPQAVQLQLQGIDADQVDKLLSALKNMRTNGDEDYTPERFREACEPGGVKMIQSAVVLYTEAYWGLEQCSDSAYLWRIVFCEVLMAKYYPEL